MQRKRILIMAGLLLVVALSVLSWGTTARAAQSGAPIRLQAATFTPSAGEKPATPPGLTISGYAAGVRGYYIVQFAGPVQQEWKDQVSKAGGEVLDYLPDYAFKVRMNPAEAARVEKFAPVAWVGLYQPAFKISPTINGAGPHLLRVRVEQGADAGQATAAIARSGATIVGRSDGILLVSADAAQIEAIANVLDVAWIEPFVMPEKHNDTGAGVIVGTNIANAAGYDGSTQIAAVADTGIGGGTAATAHPDIPSNRVTAIYNWPGATDSCFRQILDDGAIDVDSGHGTHTAGSVLSDGGPNGEGKGSAPAARLVFQATENWVVTSSLCKSLYGYPDGYYLTGLPADLRTMYQQAYNAGARVHSNSWGSAVAGDYTLNSANTDSFVWSNRDMTITFSAGNEGADANANGVVDSDSIGAPGTAKNVITVGASENQRANGFPCDTGLGYTSTDAYQTGQTCGSMGGQNLLGTAGGRWGFTAAPLNNDPTAGNQEQMASFSSRGPTDDGRIKPDVVAPGSWILSAYSSLYREGYGGSLNPRNNTYQWDGWGMPFNSAYKWMGGTSMSNPIAAGAAVVVRDFYQKAHSANASAALVKATLINSAVDMQDENNDAANDNDFPIPNVHEGWGRINVANATDGSARFADNTSGVATGGSASYTVAVGAAGSPLKITVVWSDYPSTETAAANLVNNLNLSVTAPDGTTVYRGNVFSGGWSTTGGSADAVNNVENVYVQSAAAGTWTLAVQGANVPNGPQPFAVVVDGASVDALTPVTPPAVVLHVGDLDGAKAASGKKWSATVTVTVHNGSHAPVSGATVSGAWSNGTTGNASCTTNAGGVCSVSKTGLGNNVASVRFTVSNVTLSGATYNSGLNHDPEADSNGTAITVTKP